MSKIIIEIDDENDQEMKLNCDMVLISCAKKEGNVIGSKVLTKGFACLLDLYRINQALQAQIYNIGVHSNYKSKESVEYKKAVELFNTIKSE